MALHPSYVLLNLRDGDVCTEDEYFAFCDQSEERWEFIPNTSLTSEPSKTGVIRAMAGGGENHGVIAGNLITSMNIALRGTGNRTCRVSGSDRKIHTAGGRNTFPDVSIVCGASSFHGRRRDTVTNPILVAEVLSPSTEAYDRGEKGIAYQTIPSLQQYLLIDAATPTVEVLTRTPNGWQTVTATGINAQIALPHLGIELDLSDIYALIEFDET